LHLFSITEALYIVGYFIQRLVYMEVYASNAYMLHVEYFC